MYFMTTTFFPNSPSTTIAPEMVPSVSSIGTTTLTHYPSTSTIAPDTSNLRSANMCGMATVTVVYSSNQTIADSNNSDGNAIIIAMASLVFLLITANLVTLLLCLTKQRKQRASLMDSNNSASPSNTYGNSGIRTHPELVSLSDFSLFSNEAYSSRTVSVRENPAYWKQLQGRPREMRRSLSWSGSYAYVRRFS